MMLLLLLNDLFNKFGPAPGEGSLYADRLRWAMDVAGISQSDLARKIGVTPQSVQYLSTPENNARGSKHTNAIARATGVSAQWLEMGYGPAVIDEKKKEEAPSLKAAPQDTRRIPVLNYVQAGEMTESGPVDLSQAYDDYITTDLELSDQSFALEIKGDSMVAPPGSGEGSFHEGDRIIVDCSLTPLPGDFVVAKNGEHEATFKKYRPRGADERGREVFELVPLNPDYPTMRSDRQDIRIVGVMVEHRRYRKKR